MSRPKISKALITGGSSGLGYEISGLLMKKGVTVLNVSRHKSCRGDIHIPTDLRSNVSIKRMLASVKKNHPDLDLLIPCAGVLHWNEAGRNSSNRIDTDIAVNLTGMMKVVDGLLPLIRKNSGNIVIIGSTSSFNTPPGSSVYCAAKHGVLGYIKALQTECKNQPLRIIGMHPGGFRSAFHTKAGTDIDQATLIDPRYLAELVLHLVSLPLNMEISEIIINRKVITNQ